MTLLLGAPLLLVGAGKMGGALLEGWLEEGLDPALVYVQDPAPPAEISDLLEKYGVKGGEHYDLPAKPGVIVLAVKPQIMDAVLPGVAGCLGPDSVVLSIAAGRTISSIAEHFEGATAIVRSMPNTHATIGSSDTPTNPARV